MDKKIEIIQLKGNELKRYQECVLDIAKDLVRVCESEGIEYSLSGGSILGAVRHKGFIPWDDDIDINIPRASYSKLLSVFEEKMGEKYYIQTPKKFPQIGILVTQIRKKNTIARRKYDWNLEQCGVSIDIYIIENVFNNPVKRFFQKNISMGLSFAVSAIRACNNCGLPKELINLEGRVLNYTKSKLIIGKLLKVISLKKWIEWCDFWYSCCKDNNSKMVSIPTGRKHFSGEMYLRSEMCIFRKEKFETENFNVPIYAEKYLEFFYGNYMELPPVGKRERHLFLELRF
ncbi:lipopolysaccharide cholinephosphotransferase [Muricomes intestini]|uniref:Lipopolysaccharide cholinephosphotransferase n=1 Tax=Muricomes intestini TaxID=1796634 RepID=A0A4R3K2H0_9FIRM|nr:LicD family protein [Muricomes intestini]TCS76632.1 lipopolysaccharide cholinephosphotransferase [Muricomes intestini]